MANYIYGLPNRCISELSAKILSSPKLLNYIYYTDREHEDVDIFALPTPNAIELINEHIFIGRRIPRLMDKVGAFIGMRVNRYEPVSNKKSPLLIKKADIDIDVICHKDCQTTLRGTRDITIITILQEILENEDLTGIASNVEIISTTEILGLDVDFSGYQLKLRITGFNLGLLEEEEEKDGTD